MGSRLILGVIAVLAAMMALVLESSAAEIRKDRRVRATPRPTVRMYYGGYYGQIGGHSYGPVPERFEFLNGSTYNYPGYYNNQFFWERVQTQRNFPVQY